MAASFIELARNDKIVTQIDANGIHTLKVLDAGANVASSHVEFARNPKIATSLSGGLHTLKTIDAGANVADSFVFLSSNPKIATSFDIATGQHTIKTVTV